MKKNISFTLFLLVTVSVLYCHSAYAQSIQISTPNGGENWRLGFTQNITWTNGYLGPSPTATLELLKDGVRVGEIASGVRVESLPYSWIVGNYTGGTASPGTGYSIRITVNYFAMSLTDTSDSTFQIISLDRSPASGPAGDMVHRFLRVMQPYGGERWPMGSTQTISWQYGSGMTGNVRILITRAGAPIYTIATDVPISARSYAWVIPGGGTGESTRVVTGEGTSEGVRRILIGEEGEGGGATSTTGLKIMIESLSMPGLTDESDGTFTVYTPGAITVTQPRHVSVVDAGSPFVIRWDKSGDMGSRVRIDLYQDSRKIATIDGSTNNDGNFSWNVPLKPSGSGFKVVVETLDLVPVRGQSETFKIKGLKSIN